MAQQSMVNPYPRQVIKQDNTSDIVSVRMCEKLGDFTLAAGSAVDTYTLTLTAGHGVVVGNIVCLRENGRFYQGTATVVATNTVTLDTPLDQSFTPAAVCFRSSPDANVNGSVTRRIFSVSPPAGEKWHIYGMDLSITDATAMDDSTFGGVAALTKGLVFRRKDGEYLNFFNVKTNGEFYLRASSLQYSAKAAAGQYGILVELSFDQHNGTIVELDPASGDELQMIVQDDLTGLTSFKITVSGHVVTD